MSFELIAAEEAQLVRLLNDKRITEIRRLVSLAAENGTPFPKSLGDELLVRVTRLMASNRSGARRVGSPDERASLIGSGVTELTSTHLEWLLCLIRHSGDGHESAEPTPADRARRPLRRRGRRTDRDDRVSSATQERSKQRR